MSKAALARELGVSRAAVCRWESWERTPNRELRSRIRKVTAGAVTLAELDREAAE
jgi:DNA-binding transcriptional regulator YiaG